MSAYYNEIDPYAAAWLRNLIDAGHIAPGDVDERSIEDVKPDDLRPYAQCHFFAGIGVWNYALRLAGWPDDRRVWTGSCPCQPFSAAGKGAGFTDERHLWPAWFHLITQCEPERIYGEQVASKAVEPWIDLVQSDLEALDYAVGAVAFPSAGVGAPHIRDRCYFVGVGRVGHADEGRSRRDAGTIPSAQSGTERGVRRVVDGVESTSATSGGVLGDTVGPRLAQRIGLAGISGGPIGADARQAIERTGVQSGVVADDDDDGQHRQQGLRVRGPHFHDADGRGPVGGFWAGADWIACRDDKWRPVEPGTFPLAHGSPARVGRLRAYGNAINAEAAATFIGTTL